MINQLNIFNFFTKSSPSVQIIILLLIVASLVSWTCIIQRYWSFKKENFINNKFLKRFWQTQDLTQLFLEFKNQPQTAHGMSQIFYDGFKELTKIRKLKKPNLEWVAERIHLRLEKEEERLQRHLPYFATLGSIAPYLGLLGTVLGIITVFKALGYADDSQPTLSLVAPGIAEALIVTALGLFTAIPAVIAYNRFSSKCQVILNSEEHFGKELMLLISQQWDSMDESFNDK